jgi:glycosyltransferase involved in cell wall biosynthesis
VKRSLSVVLPVRNAERTLSDNLQHIFDVLADLTERFEVVLIDDGSTDQTLEVAHELSVIYPQLRVARNASRATVPGSPTAHLEQARGDVVVLQHSREDFSPSELRRIWEWSQADDGAAAMRRYDLGTDPAQGLVDSGMHRPPAPAEFPRTATSHVRTIRQLGQRWTGDAGQA